MVRVLGDLWTTLAVSCVHSRRGLDRHRVVGNARGIDVTIHAAPARVRPGDVIGVIRGHPGGCHRPGDLLQCRSYRSARHTPLARAFNQERIKRMSRKTLVLVLTVIAFLSGASLAQVA